MRCTRTVHGESAKVRQATKLEYIVALWLGIMTDASSIDLGDLSTLVDGEQIRFKIDSNKDLVLDISAYPNSVPVAVGRATLALTQANRSLRMLTENLMGLCDDLADLVSIVG